jgi:hypothetical protein
MKRQIRQSCFETNSSSTHAICIATDTLYNIPKTVSFGFGDFGWRFDKLTSRQERANYLYTCLGYCNFSELKKYIEFISNTLYKNGVKDIDFESFKLGIYYWNNKTEIYFEPNDGYVDHGNETKEFVDAVCSNEKMLLDYLFSDKSFILTGNDNYDDNDDDDVDVHVDYPHEEFYKGN